MRYYFTNFKMAKLKRLLIPKAGKIVEQLEFLCVAGRSTKMAELLWKTGRNNTLMFLPR